MAIYITGDIHCPLDIHKLRNKSFPEGKSLSKNDYLIICGDTALCWNDGNEEKWWQKWLNNKPYTTLFVDGNHDNIPMLNSYPVSEWKGGKVHFIQPSLIHLMRGEIYNINGLKFLAIGGAKSQDRIFRTEGVNWWPEEEINYVEYKNAICNLKKHGNSIDYVISHDCPTNIMYRINFEYIETNTNRFLEEIRQEIDFEKWFFGHHHKNKTFKTEFYEEFIGLYDKIVKL